MNKSRNAVNGMTPKHASSVKKEGHEREIRRKQILMSRGIKSEILGGTIKPDIKRADGKQEGVKGGSKTQWFLFSYKNIVESTKFTELEKKIFTKWGSCFTTPNPYCEVMSNVIKENPRKWIEFFISDGKIDIIVLEDRRNGAWYEFEIETFLDKLISQIKDIYFTDTKVVFKGGGGDVWPDKPRRKDGIVMMELDRRSSKKLSLFHSPLDVIIDCVK